MNQGIAADFVEELAVMPSFKQATCYIISPERMEDRDFVTRFVSFYLQDYKSYQPDLDSFLTKGMSQIKNITQEQRGKMKQGFEDAMVAAYKIFGNDAFRKRTDIEDRRKPLNKALFEVLSVLLGKLSLEERNLLIKRGKRFREKFIELNRDDAFRYSISSGTGQRDSVIRRYTETIRIINETLSND